VLIKSRIASTFVFLNKKNSSLKKSSFADFLGGLAAEDSANGDTSSTKCADYQTECASKVSTRHSSTVIANNRYTSVWCDVTFATTDDVVITVSNHEGIATVVTFDVAIVIVITVVIIVVIIIAII
jgi:hypothetical protein